MIALENISSRKGDEIFLTNLNNSFEIGRIHGIWNETDNVNTWFLKLLTGNIPLDSGIIRYMGIKLDPGDVAYYNKADMSGPCFTTGAVPYPDENKPVYLFDDIFDPADMRSFIRTFNMVLSLKEMGRTILITSTDYRVLTASTDFFHILSRGVFQAKIHFKQYDLLDEVLKHVKRSC